MNSDQRPSTTQVPGAASPASPTGTREDAATDHTGGNTWMGGSPFSGKTVLLQPITPVDYEPLFQMELGEYLGPRWRQRGATPSFEAFLAKLHAGVLCQYTVVRKEVGEKVGYVTVYDPHLADGYAYFAGAKFNEADGTGCVVEGAALLIDHVFHQWNVRKLYAVVSGYNMHQFGSGIVGLFEEEARLRDHEFWQGRYWDQVTLAVYRQQWMRRRRALQAVFGLPDRQPLEVDQ